LKKEEPQEGEGYGRSNKFNTACNNWITGQSFNQENLGKKKRITTSLDGGFLPERATAGKIGRMKERDASSKERGVRDKGKQVRKSRRPRARDRAPDKKRTAPPSRKQGNLGKKRTLNFSKRGDDRKLHHGG